MSFCAPCSVEIVYALGSTIAEHRKSENPTKIASITVAYGVPSQKLCYHIIHTIPDFSVRPGKMLMNRSHISRHVFNEASPKSAAHHIPGIILTEARRLPRIRRGGHALRKVAHRYRTSR
jgi:hypothetical protein